MAIKIFMTSSTKWMNLPMQNIEIDVFRGGRKVYVFVFMYRWQFYIFDLHYKVRS